MYFKRSIIAYTTIDIGLKIEKVNSLAVGLYKIYTFISSFCKFTDVSISLLHRHLVL